ERESRRIDVPAVTAGPACSRSGQRVDALAVRRLVSERRSLRFHRRISELLADDFAYDEHAALNRVRLRFLAFPRQTPGPCEKTRSLRRVELDAREPVGVGGGKGIRREPVNGGEARRDEGGRRREELAQSTLSLEDVLGEFAELGAHV